MYDWENGDSEDACGHAENKHLERKMLRKMHVVMPKTSI